jgi:N-methylhydantoinase A
MDVRYTGQGYELSVTDLHDVAAEFNRLHEQRYGYADPGRRIEVVNVRVRASVKNTRVPPVAVAASAAASQPGAEVGAVAGAGAGAGAGTINMYFAGETHAAPIVDRTRLAPGDSVKGPALIVEYSTTTVVPPGYTARMDAFGNLILERPNE